MVTAVLTRSTKASPCSHFASTQKYSIFAIFSLNIFIYKQTMYTFTPPSPNIQSAAERYSHLCKEAEALLHGERNAIANMANFSSLLYHALPNVNWVGFYLYDDDELVLGPFQGKPACIRIPLGKGVCGTAAQQRTTLLVADVDAFPGHIACDAASRSEIVIPLVARSALYGVLDIDSPQPNRFTHDDQRGLEQLAHIFLRETLL